MGGADGIEAHFLELFYLPGLGVIHRHGADGTVVVMQAAALELDFLAIDPQAVLHVRLDGADAEQHAFGVLRGVFIGDDMRFEGANVFHCRL